MTMSARTFQFRYTVFTVTAQLDTDRLATKTGVRHTTAPIGALQHLYVRRAPAREDDELVLTYATDRGRLRRVRIFSDRDEPGFAGLVEALLALRPDIDIRHLAPAEAWRRMGARELEWVVLPAVMGVGLLVLALVLAPMWVHGFDRGAATLDVPELLSGAPPGTRNLTVIGRLVADQGVQAKQGADARLETVTMWLPLVGPAWRPGDPVHLVLEVRGLRDADPTELASHDRFEGVLRDALWERLDETPRKLFRARDLKLSADVRVLQLGARARDDLTLASVLVGGLSLLVLGVFATLRARRNRGLHDAVHAPLNRG